MLEVYKTILKRVLKVEEKGGKLYVTVGAPKYDKKNEKVKLHIKEVAAAIEAQGKYKKLTPLKGAMYVNFWDDYQSQVVWEYEIKSPVKPKPATKKAVTKKKTVPTKETPKPTEG